MAFSVSNASYALKTLYPSNKILSGAIAASASPFFAKVRKTTRFTGENLAVPVLYSDIAGRSSTFSEAQENKAGSLGKKFLITRAKNYAVADLEGDLIEASEGNEGAFVSQLKAQMDSAINAIGRSIGIQLYGDGVGNLGVVSDITSDVVTLSRTRDIHRFEVGMSVVFAASGTASPRGSGTGVAITAINRDDGKFTIASTPASTAANDLIWVEGDYVSASDRLVMKGLGAWVPQTAPTSTSFFSVDRSADPQRLGGVRVNASSYGTLKEALFAGAVKCAEMGGRPDHIFCSFASFESLVNDLETKVQYTEFKSADVGFEGVKVIGPTGVLNVYPDTCCQQDQAFVLQMDTWELATLGQCPHVLSRDGNQILRSATEDAYEVRIGAYGNLFSRMPGWNCIVHTIS